MHKKIGIIGGLSPESTVSYYLNITRKYVEQFGDYSYPEIIIYSVNLENYHTWRAENRWDKIVEDLVLIAQKLKFAGAEFGIIATNTMHKVYEELQSKVKLPFIHVLTPTVEAINKAEIKKVGLLGTKFTMSERFYKDGLSKNGITPIVPNIEQQEAVHRIIVEELVRGIIKDESRKVYVEIIDSLVLLGAEGIILGCTEIPLLISPQDCNIPTFDTAILHSDAALFFATSE
jgi:aspartate racemase